MTQRRSRSCLGLVLCALLLGGLAAQTAAAAPARSGAITIIVYGDWQPLTSREMAPSQYNTAGTFWNTEGEAYRNKFQSLQPGVYYFFTHQGILPAGRRPYGDLNLRVNEYKFWSGTEKTAMLKEMGLSVKPFSALKNVFKDIVR
jgi:hypothetical protein